MTNGDTSARQAPQSTQCFQFKGDTEIYPSKVSPGDKGQEELGEGCGQRDRNGGKVLEAQGKHDRGRLLRGVREDPTQGHR